MRIPPGAADGSRVRIAGQGGASPNGGARGDLVLTIHVAPHPFFRREGDDLHLDVPVTLAEAYRGAKVKVPTVDGSVTLKVPEGTQSGTTVRLRGKGVARKGRPGGDLYVHFQVRIPTSSPEAAKLARPDSPSSRRKTPGRTSSSEERKHRGEPRTFGRSRGGATESERGKQEDQKTRRERLGST